MAKPIRVWLVDYGNRNIMMRYRDSASGKSISKTTGTRHKCEAKLIADRWQSELRAKTLLGDHELRKGMLGVESTSDIAAFAPAHDQGFVYFLHELTQDWVRIGKSSNPELTVSRIRQEQCLIPTKTRLLALMHGSCNEGDVHRLLSQSKTRHSWYVLGEQVKFFIRRHCYSVADRRVDDAVYELELSDPAVAQRRADDLEMLYEKLI